VYTQYTHRYLLLREGVQTPCQIKQELKLRALTMSTGFLLFQPSFLFFQVIVTEQFGLIPDGKGVKVRGFNCDKKQGLQVSEKQLISPWDLLEGHKNPAPLSFHWFQAGLEKTRV
jgi:hypothetical protein